MLHDKLSDSKIMVFACSHAMYKTALLSEIYLATHSAVKCEYDHKTLIKKYFSGQCPVCEVTTNVYAVCGIQGMMCEASVCRAIVPCKYLRQLKSVVPEGTVYETEKNVQILLNGEFERVPTHDALPVWQYHHTCRGYRNLLVLECYSMEFAPGLIYVGDYNQFVSSVDTITHNAEVRTMRKHIPEKYCLAKRKQIQLPDVQRANACLAKSLINPGYYVVLSFQNYNFGDSGNENREILLFDSGELILVDANGENPIRL